MIWESLLEKVILKNRLKVFVLIFSRRAFQGEGKQIQRPKDKHISDAFVKQQGDDYGQSRSSEGKNGIRSEK